MQYLLNLADICIRVEAPFPLLDNDSTKEFFSENASAPSPDLFFSYCSNDELPLPEDIRFAEARRIYTGEGDGAATFFSARPDAPPYAWVPRSSMSQGNLVCHYRPGSEHLMNYKRNVITLMDIEATLLHFNSIIFHASLIRWDGCSILFSAPAGTGKSTQAELWKKFAGADILNGDRSALRRKDGIWHAYGLPYAGTSGIYRNENAPLRAVVALRQAPENSIRRLSGAEAFRYLYSEILIHRWDAVFESRAAGLFMEIIEEIPVYLLSCRPDREAVELLKNELESKEKQESQT